MILPARGGGGIIVAKHLMHLELCTHNQIVPLRSCSSGVLLFIVSGHLRI